SDEMRRMEEQSNRAKEEFEQKLRQAKDEMARVFEEIQAMRQSQVALMLDLSRIELWKSEAEWEKRIEGIRGFHEPVRIRFIHIRDFLAERSRGLDLTALLHITGELALLKEELSIEESLMNDESVVMQQLKVKHPQATFLGDIEESTKAAASEARKLMMEIEELERVMKSGGEILISPVQFNHCLSSFEKLEKSI
ncbi:hypothetical protein PMAYCL1PPCAC_13853, partial [Pristionchus mayeri]